jgi:orotidine-5'-phosphate decarboxylase
MSDSNGRDKLLVALDVDSGDRALELARRLHAVAGGFKVGSRLFTLEGPSIVRRIVDLGTRVFLDLKFHDIPNQVAQTIEAAVQTGAWMVNVHASGGTAMMQGAARAAATAAAQHNVAKPILIGVTVLTSMDEPALRTIGIERRLLDQVIALAGLAKEAGLDGVVASSQETAALRQACGSEFVIVTPGIRGAGAEKHDQARTMGPAEAVRAGASYIVVGRPIIAATDPRSAAEAIIEELVAG